MTTSTRHGRWPCCSMRRRRRRARWRRCWGCSASAGSPARSRLPPTWWRRPGSGAGHAGRAPSHVPTRCATRSPPPAGRPATRRAARCSTAAMPADVVYGTHPVREALRGRREVLHVWCTRRAGEASPWLPSDAAVVPPARLDELAGSADHQGGGAEVEPYPYADPGELLSRERPLLVALAEVTGPHNLGAVARVAEGAGADGLLITRRRSAGVTAAVCRASAGAVEHLPVAQVENLAEALLGSKRPNLWSYAAAGDAAHPYDGHDYRDGTVFVLGAEGRGLRPRVRASCDEAVAIPMAGRIESLNV